MLQFTPMASTESPRSLSDEEKQAISTNPEYSTLNKRELRVAMALEELPGVIVDEICIAFGVKTKDAKPAQQMLALVQKIEARAEARKNPRTYPFTRE